MTHPGLFFAYIAMGVYVFLMQYVLMDHSAYDRTVAQAVIDTLAEIHMTNKEACALMDLDLSQWSKQLRCDPNCHISLIRIVRLGSPFMFSLMQRLAFISMQRTCDELREDISVRRSA